MMMPANFTAVNSEVVYGGADLFSVLADTTAPIWNAANIKKFNTNLITIIGNSYVSKVLGATLGVMFSGAWGTKDDTVAEAWGYDKDKKITIFGKNKALWNALDPNGDKETNGFNKFMQVVGLGAAVYQLGTNETKKYVKEVKFLGTTGKI